VSNWEGTRIPIRAMNETREVMNVRQAAAYLEVSADALYKYVSESAGFPAFKIGNRWRFKKSLLDGWIDAQIAQRNSAACHSS
jgi:excisionase family DNA binding protein